MIFSIIENKNNKKMGRKDAEIALEKYLTQPKLNLN